MIIYCSTVVLATYGLYGLQFYIAVAALLSYRLLLSTVAWAAWLLSSRVVLLFAGAPLNNHNLLARPRGREM